MAGVNSWLDEVRPTALANAEEISDVEEREQELADIAEVFRPYEVVEGERIV